MFRVVVWGTDGSPAADRALPVVRQMVRESGGRLVVVHLEEFYAEGTRGGSIPLHADAPEMIAKIRQQVDGLRLEGLEVDLRVLPGTATGWVTAPARAIADIAAAEHADVVVVGTRGHTPVAGLLVGSVTQRLLHVSSCPVLAVPAHGEMAEKPTEDKLAATSA